MRMAISPRLATRTFLKLLTGTGFLPFLAEIAAEGTAEAAPLRLGRTLPQAGLQKGFRPGRVSEAGSRRGYDKYDYTLKWESLQLICAGAAKLGKKHRGGAAVG